MVVIRKDLNIEKGEDRFLPEIRYFFYTTNNRDVPSASIVYAANERCDQANIPTNAERARKNYALSKVSFAD